MGGGPWTGRPTTTPCPQLLPAKALNPLPPFQPTAPQEKPINLTLIGFSICHNPRRSWGGGEGEGGIHNKTPSKTRQALAEGLAWTVGASQTL